jgi:hypothetical protein
MGLRQIFITVRKLRVRLWLLMALANAVILESESLRTRDHNLLSQIRDLPSRRFLRLAGLRWRYSNRPPHGDVITSRWIPCYITSGRTDRENTFQSRIHGNVCLSLREGLFPIIYLHGNVFTEPLPSTIRHNVIRNVSAKSDSASRDLEKVGLHLEQHATGTTRHKNEQWRVYSSLLRHVLSSSSVVCSHRALNFLNKMATLSTLFLHPLKVTTDTIL